MKNNEREDVINLDVNVIRGITARAIFEFIFFTVILCGMGYLAHFQVKEMINESLKESVRKHTNTIVHSIEHEFQQEIKEMHLGASMVERGEVSVNSLINVTNALERGTENTGILRRDGSAVDGSPKNLPDHEFQELTAAFDGEDVIIYHRGQGMIFAVPINVNGEQCLFYQQYSDRDISKLFGIVSYDGEGRVTIGYKTGEFVEISQGEAGKFYSELYKKPGFADAYVQKINIEELQNERRVVKAFEFDKTNYIIFAALIYNDDFAVFGIVKREAVAAGVDYIHIVMIGGVVTLLLILILFARYTIKNVESKELEQEKLMALKASQTKSEFLSNMSHEIRTPINAILGMDEMILRESKEPNTIEYAENLRHAGVSLLGIVNDILDFSKIEAGKMEIIPVEYHLSSLLNDLVNMIQTRAKKKNLEFKIKADEKIPSVLFGDEIRIKQIITNILTNAVKYTEKGGITLTVDYKEKGSESIILMVKVQDTGIGIKEEDIEKLFNAFERIEEERNRTIEGTGLGMNITQQLLHLMKSSLEVESVYGEGSTFSFELEQKVMNREPIGNFEETFKKSLQKHREYHELFTAPDAHILVVDDTVMNLTVMKGLLKQTKIKIDTAESGEECIEMTTKNKYDIIFLDHRMPGMDGIETLHEIKNMPVNQNADTPMISLTANAISGAREQYIKAGFEDYLTKPIDSAELEKMIIKYLPAEKIKKSGETVEEENLKTEMPEWLKKVKGLKPQDGIEHCGDLEMYLDALKVFAKSIKSGAAEIEKYFKAEDWKNYTTKVHALKSTSKIIGARELSERAKRLEDAGNSGYTNEIKKDTKYLLKLYKMYEEELKPLIEDEEKEKPLIEESELQEAYEAIKESAMTFDYDSLKYVIESLEEYKMPESEKERYQRIKDAAAKLDWDEIKKETEQAK